MRRDFTMNALYCDAERHGARSARRLRRPESRARALHRRRAPAHPRGLPAHPALLPLRRPVWRRGGARRRRPRRRGGREGGHGAAVGRAHSLRTAAAARRARRGRGPALHARRSASSRRCSASPAMSSWSSGWRRSRRRCSAPRIRVLRLAALAVRHERGSAASKLRLSSADADAAGRRRPPRRRLRPAHGRGAAKAFIYRHGAAGVRRRRADRLGALGRRADRRGAGGARDTCPSAGARRSCRCAAPTSWRSASPPGRASAASWRASRNGGSAPATRRRCRPAARQAGRAGARRADGPPRRLILTERTGPRWHPRYWRGSAYCFFLRRCCCGDCCDCCVEKPSSGSPEATTSSA